MLSLRVLLRRDTFLLLSCGGNERKYSAVVERGESQKQASTLTPALALLVVQHDSGG
jgi:hypothetical protein